MSKGFTIGGTIFLILVVGYFLFPKQYSTPKAQKSDTSFRYIKFFTHVGDFNGNDYSKDTDAFAIRVIKDSVLITHDTIGDKITMNKTTFSDSVYFVPYDSVFKIKDTVRHKDTSYHRTVYLQLPNKGWVVWDYNRLASPLAAWQ